MQVIDERSIRAHIGEQEAMESAEIAFRALAEGRAELPPPMGFSVPDVDGEVHVKAAYLAGSPVFAVKVATGFYQNTARGLPSGAGVVLVFDSETGFPTLLLDDNGYLTDLRTAAAGALAARLLSSERVETVGVLGSGIQARYQLRALARVRRWQRTQAWSPTPEHLMAYCEEMQRELGVPVEAAPGPDRAVEGADIVITATPSREPLFEASRLEPHATVIAVGSDGPDKRELSPAAFSRAAKIVVDRLSQCVELGEVHHAVAEGFLEPTAVHAELGDVLIGRKAGRERDDDLIICDLTGVGAQDAAIAEITWARFTKR